MTFIEALKTGRPMRRKSNTITFSEPWLYLGLEGDGVSIPVPCWREIKTGVATGLHAYDYIAEDWEVMP